MRESITVRDVMVITIAVVTSALVSALVASQVAPRSAEPSRSADRPGETPNRPTPTRPPDGTPGGNTGATTRAGDPLSRDSGSSPDAIPSEWLDEVRDALRDDIRAAVANAEQERREPLVSRVRAQTDELIAFLLPRGLTDELRATLLDALARDLARMPDRGEDILTLQWYPEALYDAIGELRRAGVETDDIAYDEFGFPRATTLTDRGAFPLFGSVQGEIGEFDLHVLHLQVSGPVAMTVTAEWAYDVALLRVIARRGGKTQQLVPRNRHATPVQVFDAGSYELRIEAERLGVDSGGPLPGSPPIHTSYTLRTESVPITNVESAAIESVSIEPGAWHVLTVRTDEGERARLLVALDGAQTDVDVQGCWCRLPLQSSIQSWQVLERPREEFRRLATRPGLYAILHQNKGERTAYIRLELRFDE